jgi:putative CocE/NonD family hydrolase
MDFHDVFEWAGTRDWSNGSVGLTGVSYLAISQWVAAGGGPPPYLKATMPWEGQTDAYREVLYHGGVPETAFTEFWVGRVNSGANSPPLPPVQNFRIIHKSPPLMRAIQFIPDRRMTLTC